MFKVMGESYDSIGSRVLRHFRHYISGNQHVWLQGDFRDPTLGCMEIKHGQDMETQDEQTHDEPVTVQTVYSDDHSCVKSTSDVADVQTDSASLKVTIPIVSEHEARPSLSAVEEFTFEKGVPSVANGTCEIDHEPDRSEENNRSDETDRIDCGNADVIDIQPMIVSNRKRHAHNGTSANLNGVSPEKNAFSGTKRIKVEDFSPHINTSNISVCLRQNDANKRRTLNQRAVYYHAEENHFDTYFS